MLVVKSTISWSKFFSKDFFPKGILLRLLFNNELDELLLFNALEKDNRLAWLFSLLSTLWYSADFDCWMKLINKKKETISFFNIPKFKANQDKWLILRTF